VACASGSRQLCADSLDQADQADEADEADKGERDHVEFSFEVSPGVVRVVVAPTHNDARARLRCVVVRKAV
jgi:hypothetical protein